jgi:hypothetical protein
MTTDTEDAAMSCFGMSHAETEARELARLERRFPFAALLIGAIVAGEIAATVLALVAQG